MDHFTAVAPAPAPGIATGGFPYSDSMLTVSPGEMNDDLAIATDPAVDPLTLFEQTDSDSLLRQLCDFYSIAPAEDPPAPRSIPFEERWQHTPPREYGRVLASLVDKLDAADASVFERDALAPLFFACHGAAARQLDADAWERDMRRIHLALANCGLLGALWPRVVDAVAQWDAANAELKAAPPPAGTLAPALVALSLTNPSSPSSSLPSSPDSPAMPPSYFLGGGGGGFGCSEPGSAGGGSSATSPSSSSNAAVETARNAQQYMVALLGCMYSHAAACAHFSIAVDLADGGYFMYFAKMLVRLDGTRIGQEIVKKIVLLLNVLFLCQFGGRERLRSIKATLLRFHGYREQSTNSSQDPTAPPFATKATDHELRAAYAELSVRYPAVSLQPLVETLPSPLSSIRATKSTPTNVSDAAAAIASTHDSGLSMPRRTFAARKKVQSHDHLLLPHDEQTAPPLPIQEAVDAYRAHFAPTIELAYSQQLGSDTGAVDMWEWEYPESLAAHFEALEGSLYPQLLPILPDLVATLLKVQLINVPHAGYYPPPRVDASGVPRVPLPSPTIAVARRDREIPAAAAASLLLRLVRHMRLAHPVLGDHVAQCIVDANGLTVQVKTLTAVENLESMMREHDGGSHLPSDAPPLPPSALRLHTDHATTSANSPDAAEPAFLRSLLATDRAPTSDPALMTAASSGGPSQHDQVLRGPRGYSHRAMQTVADVLHLLAVLVRRKPHRVLFLYHAKAFNVLRRLVELNNFDIMIRSLKLIKTMMPFMSRKWRQANIGVISRIYHHLTPKLVDDYLMTTDADSEGAEGMKQEAHAKELANSLHKARYPEAHAQLLRTTDAAERRLNSPAAPGGSGTSADPGALHRRYSSTASIDSSSSGSSSGSASGAGSEWMDVAWLYYRDPEGSAAMASSGAASAAGDGGSEDEEDGIGSGTSAVSGILAEWRDEYEETLELVEWWRSPASTGKN